MAFIIVADSLTAEGEIFGGVSHDAPHLDKEFYRGLLSHPVSLSGPGNLETWSNPNSSSVLN